MSYRKDIHNEKIGTDVVIDTGTNNDDWVELSTVLTYFDDIECRVSEIQKLLNNISGLTEIDDITELVNKLSNDLY